MLKDGAKTIMVIMIQTHQFLPDVANLIFMEDNINWIIKKKQREYSGLRQDYLHTTWFKSDSK
jgi:hypothetical protein